MEIRSDFLPQGDMQNPPSEVMKVPWLISPLLDLGVPSIQTYLERHGKEDIGTNAAITFALMRPFT